MLRVVLAFTDVGLAVALQAALEQPGRDVAWRADLVHGPGVSPPAAAVVLLDVDGAGPVLDTAVAAWRALDPPPALIGLVADDRAVARATALRLTLATAAADDVALTAALTEATRLRFTAALSPALARHLLALAAADDDAIVAAARALDPELVHAALRWHAHDYATLITVADPGRIRRVLTAPELGQLVHLGGTRTVQAVVRAGPLDGIAAARLLWTLGSLGVITFSAAPLDRSTAGRRQVADLRDHLAARAQRLARSTFYDVLEVSPLAEDADIERAFRALHHRYGPDLVAAIDLGDHAALADPCWDLITRAHQILVDAATRGRYADWLRERLHERQTAWAIDATAGRVAAEAYQRGQHALVNGDPHRGLSELAVAARHHPGHPEYETGLAWARYRVEVAAGRALPELARRERIIAEAAIVGSRPWPRALITVALLCAAEGDPDAARWHLREALTVEPSSAAARALLARLGS